MGEIRKKSQLKSPGVNKKVKRSALNTKEMSFPGGYIIGFISSLHDMRECFSK